MNFKFLHQNCYILSFQELFNVSLLNGTENFSEVPTMMEMLIPGCYSLLFAVWHWPIGGETHGQTTTLQCLWAFLFPLRSDIRMDKVYSVCIKYLNKSLNFHDFWVFYQQKKKKNSGTLFSEWTGKFGARSMFLYYTHWHL